MEQEEQNLVLMTEPVQPNTVVFSAKQEEIIRVSQGKFYFKGEEVEDKYQVYERFNEWLKMAEEAKNKEKISEDEAKIREILNDPGSWFVGYSQEDYNLHIFIHQGKKYYIEPKLNIINRIEYQTQPKNKYYNGTTTSKYQLR